MEWWQILLIVLASIFAGIFLAAGSSYLVKWFLGKRETAKWFVRKRETTAPVEEQFEFAAPDLVEQFAQKEEAIIAAEEQLEWTAPDLVEEVENNLKIATEPWTGKLLPFQTQVWSRLQAELDRVPANLREELAQVYIDIRLTNNIVRLSTQFNHRSHDLDEQYRKLCSSIGERLSKIKPLIERPRE